MAGIAQVLNEAQQFLSTVHPKLEFRLGSREIDRHGAPPRIVWVIPGAAHQAPEKVKATGRSLLTRSVDVIAHVWGSTLGELELLIDDTISAMYRVAYGSISFGGEEWPDTDDAHLGFAALLKFSVSTPVIERKFKDPDRSLDGRTILVRPTNVEIQYDDTPFIQTLPLTGFFRDYRGGTWHGTPSAGPSGLRALPPASGVPAPAVNSLNGHGVALCTTGTMLSGTLTTGDLLSANAFSIWALIRINSASPNAVFSMLTDEDQWFGIMTYTESDHYDTSLVVWNSDINNFVMSPFPVSLSTWSHMQCVYDGTNVRSRVNGGSWTVTPSSDIEDLSSVIQVAFGVGDYEFELAELGATNIALPTQVFDQIRDYVSHRYLVTV